MIHAAEYQCTSRARVHVFVAVATGSWVVVVGWRTGYHLVTRREDPKGYIAVPHLAPTLDTGDHVEQREQR